MKPNIKSAQAHFFPPQPFFLNWMGEGFSGPTPALSLLGRWLFSQTPDGFTLSLWSLVWPQVKRGGRCGYQWVPQFLGAGVSSLNFTFRCLCIFLRSALPALPVGMCGLPRSPFRELGVCLRQSPFLSSPSDRPCGLKMSSKYILLCALQRSLNFAINGNVTDLLWLRAKS